MWWGVHSEAYAECWETSTGNPGKEDWGGVEVARRELWQREAKGEEEVGQTLQINGIAHGRAEICARTEYFEKSKLYCWGLGERCWIKIVMERKDFNSYLADRIDKHIF